MFFTLLFGIAIGIAIVKWAETNMFMKKIWTILSPFLSRFSNKNQDINSRLDMFARNVVSMQDFTKCKPITTPYKWSPPSSKCCLGDCESNSDKEADNVLSPIAKYEKENNCRLLIINHRSSNSDFPLSVLKISTDSLTLVDAIDVVNILNEYDAKEDDDLYSESSEEDSAVYQRIKELHIILNTSGGAMQAAEVIANALLSYKGRIKLFIPHYAQSAGLLIAICADEIYLGKNAFITPADPLFMGIPASSIVEFCNSTFATENNSYIGDLALLAKSQAQQALDRAKDFVTKVREAHNANNRFKTRQTIQLDYFITEFLSGKYNHDKPFTYKDLAKTVENTFEGVPSELMKIYDSHCEAKGSKNCISYMP